MAPLLADEGPVATPLPGTGGRALAILRFFDPGCLPPLRAYPLGFLFCSNERPFAPHGALSMLTAIPATLMRGGTSRGLYFHAKDLPDDRATRDAVLLAAMGSPDVTQIDGVGGAHPL